MSRKVLGGTKNHPLPCLRLKDRTAIAGRKGGWTQKGEGIRADGKGKYGSQDREVPKDLTKEQVFKKEREGELSKQSRASSTNCRGFHPAPEKKRAIGGKRKKKAGARKEQNGVPWQGGAEGLVNMAGKEALAARAG